MSGLTADGAELVNKAFSIENPIFVLGPLAHSPRTNWPMSEQDALDILTLVSFIHRKLDRTEKTTGTVA